MILLSEDGFMFHIAPAADWTAPDGCDGDVVAFVNGTKQETGATEYSWDFGDPSFWR